MHLALFITFQYSLSSLKVFRGRERAGGTRDRWENVNVCIKRITAASTLWSDSWVGLQRLFCWRRFPCGKLSGALPINISVDIETGCYHGNKTLHRSKVNCLCPSTCKGVTGSSSFAPGGNKPRLQEVSRSVNLYAELVSSYRQQSGADHGDKCTSLFTLSWRSCSAILSVALTSLNNRELWKDQRESHGVTGLWGKPVAKSPTLWDFSHSGPFVRAQNLWVQRGFEAEKNKGLCT